MNRLCCSCPHWGASEETAWSLWDQKKMLRFVHVSDPSLSLLFLGKQEWRTRDVLADHSSCHFSPSFSKLLSPFCPTFAILCVLLLKHSSLGWESSQSSPYSLLSSLKGYSEKVVFCVWVVTLKCISHRWIGRWDVCSAHWIYPDRSVTAHTRYPLCAHLWRACSVLCIIKCSPGLFFCACWSCWVTKNKYCCFIASVARGSVKQLLPRNRELVCAPLVPIRATFPQVPKWCPLHIARLEVHKTALNVYSHPSALCRTTQNWVEVLLEHSIWLFEIQI